MGSVMPGKEHFDYVVVGAGSAGCAIAGRLSENPLVTVCLIEAGGSDQSVLIHAPVGVVAMLPRKINNWAFETVPQPGLNGRRGYQPRGKTVGGSSSINAMLYVRGHRSDYDHWAALGNHGWSCDDLLPYFRMSEHNDSYHDHYHGRGGPLNVAEVSQPSQLNSVFLQAAQAAGWPANPDYNGADQFGCFRYQVTQRNGERCSAAKAFLTPHLARPNLKVVTHAVTRRILFEGRSAIGVLANVAGEDREFLARAEVVLSAGAFGSPQILQLSGIGPVADLRAKGLPVVHALPGVGRNLQDHIDYIYSYRSPGDTDTFGISLRGGLRFVRAIAQWRRERRGLITSPFAESGAFIKSHADLEVPDLQLVFVPAIVDDHARKLHLGHGFSCHTTLLRPKSRGTVSLATPSPFDAPRIDPRFLSDPDDLRVLAIGAGLQRDILDAAPFAPFRTTAVYPLNQNDPHAVEQDIRDRADSQYHPVGTCKMGKDELAVVDDQLRVHGVRGLRVADASIMPTLIGGNTNAACIMIGEKAADLVRASFPSR